MNIEDLKLSNNMKYRFFQSERRSLATFLDEIEYHFSFPENEDLAVAIISKLQDKYHLLF